MTQLPKFVFPPRKLFSASVLTGAISLMCLSNTAQAANDPISCLNEMNGPTYQVQDTYPGVYRTQTFANLENGARVDGRGAIVMQQTQPTNEVEYPLLLRTDQGKSRSVCASSFAVSNTNPIDQSWRDSKKPNNAGVSFNGDRFTLEDARFFGTHDAIRPAKDRPDGVGEGAFAVRRVWVTWNRDDCVENDHKRSGTIEDSLFDGCYTFLSTRNKGIRDGSKERITVKNNLIRLARMPHRYREPGVSGFGNIYKSESNSPVVNWVDNIILIEGDEGKIKGGLEYSSGQLGECRNNVIIWLGSGDYPGDIPKDENCVRVIKDRSVWDEARANWIANHPSVPTLPGDPFTVSVDDSFDLSPEVTQLDVGAPNSQPDPGSDLVISNISVVDITATSASVQFNMSPAATGQTEYGTSDALGSLHGPETSLLSFHKQKLNNLEPNTVYFYRVSGTDGDGSSATSKIRSFRTSSSDTSGDGSELSTVEIVVDGPNPSCFQSADVAINGEEFMTFAGEGPYKIDWASDSGQGVEQDVSIDLKVGQCP
jgi:hypothetical protein